MLSSGVGGRLCGAGQFGGAGSKGVAMTTTTTTEAGRHIDEEAIRHDCWRFYRLDARRAETETMEEGSR